MLWLKPRTQLTFIPTEAPVMNEIKAPSERIEVKIKNDQVGKAEKGLPDTSQI